MRTVDSAIITQLQSGMLRAFLLLELNIDGTYFRYTDCDVPLRVAGSTYTPRGFKVEPIRYSINDIVDSVRFRTDNLDDTFTSAFVGGTPQESGVKLSMVVFNSVSDEIAEDETGATFGPTVHGLSLSAGQAFFNASGVDLSPFAGVAGSSTPYRIVLTDSADKQAVGWIGAADAAEALGSELGSNIGFETAGAGGADIWANWTENTTPGGALADEGAVVHGGSHACKATCGAVNNEYAHASLDISTTLGKLYKFSFWTRGDGTNSGRYWIYNANLTTYIASNLSAGVSGTDYTQVNIYFTAEDTSTRVYVSSPIIANGYAYFDDISIKEVTDVGATGVHIVSAQNGSTRNWASIEAGFNYNDSAYTFEVIGVPGIVGSPVTLFEGIIEEWSLNEQEVSIAVCNLLIRWNNRSLAKHSASCRWKKFRGQECGYSGTETWCDRSYTRCVALGNQANFGGFRWLPSIVDKEIWWGRQRA